MASVEDSSDAAAPCFEQDNSEVSPSPQNNLSNTKDNDCSPISVDPDTSAASEQNNETDSDLTSAVADDDQKSISNSSDDGATSNVAHGPEHGPDSAVEDSQSVNTGRKAAGVTQDSNANCDVTETSSSAGAVASAVETAEQDTSDGLKSVAEKMEQLSVHPNHAESGQEDNARTDSGNSSETGAVVDDPTKETSVHEQPRLNVAQLQLSAADTTEPRVANVSTASSVPNASSTLQLNAETANAGLSVTEEDHPWGSLECHAGWIQKKPVRKSQGRVKDRFLVLDGLTLTYFEDHTRATVKGSMGINNTSTVKPDPSNEHGFIFTEFSTAPFGVGRQLRARSFSKFELLMWIARIGDAIDFCKCLPRAGSHDRPIFQKSVVVDCDFPAQRWRGECRLRLNGNLLWFDRLESRESGRRRSSSDRRSKRMSVSRHRGGSVDGHINAISTNDAPRAEVSNAIGCISLTHATSFETLNSVSIRVANRMSLAAAIKEHSVTIKFLTTSTRKLLETDVASLLQCIRSATQGPLDDTLYVHSCFAMVIERACEYLTGRFMDSFYEDFLQCRIFLPNFLGSLVILVPKHPDYRFTDLLNVCDELMLLTWYFHDSLAVFGGPDRASSSSPSTISHPRRAIKYLGNEQSAFVFDRPCCSHPIRVPLACSCYIFVGALRCLSQPRSGQLFCESSMKQFVYQRTKRGKIFYIVPR